MPRVLALLSSTLLFAAAAPGQCPQATDAGLVRWAANTSYGSALPVDDEGLSPPIPLGFSLPWADPVQAPSGFLDQVWIGSNGEVYLTDSTAGLIEPAGGALYGVDSLAEFEGAPGSSVRVVCMGLDTQASIAPGANWSVTYEVVPAGPASSGRFRIVWQDLRRYGNPTDRFSCQLDLLKPALPQQQQCLLQFHYGPTVPGDAQWVGASSANGVTSPPSLNFGSSFTAPRMLFRESFSPATWDLAGTITAVRIVATGSAGLGSVAVTFGSCASNVPYGTGCHSYDIPSPTETFYQFFPNAAAASPALQGNAMVLTPTGTGYSASWLPGGAAGLYLAPTGSATSLPPDDDGNEVVALPGPFPSNAGPVSQINVSHNGIVTLGTNANNAGYFGITGANVAAATGEAFYSFSDFADDNVTPVPSGRIKTHAVGNVFCVTWDGVHHWATPQVSTPSTFQFQFDLTTGTVRYVWLTIDSNSTSQYGSSWLVGYTGPGAGTDPGSIQLAAALPLTTTNNASGTAVTLSAAPRPVLNPSTTVTYTAGNLPEVQPGSNLYLATLFFSLTPLPGGFDLAGILTTVPGCSAWIGSLDLDLGGQVTNAPTASWTYTFASGTFAPGDVIAAQAVALFDPGFPLGNGESGGFLLSNGVLSTANPF